jgi:hypothetical protein
MKFKLESVLSCRFNRNEVSEYKKLLSDFKLTETLAEMVDEPVYNLFIELDTLHDLEILTYTLNRNIIFGGIDEKYSLTIIKDLHI